jgi:peroxidase
MTNPLSTYVHTMRRLLNRSAGRKRSTPKRHLKFESLETRQLFSVNTVTSTSTSTASTVESIDGTGNNLVHTTWGSTNTDLLRIAAAAYSDGISTPAGADRPDARAVSNAVMDQAADTDILNNRDLSAFVYAWGQFIDHDLDLTPGGTTAFNIAVPVGDPSFDPTGTGTQIISLNRSITDAATGTSKSNPAQQVNTITAYLDGSMIYGSDATRAAALRTFSGGLLKTSAGNLLPFNTTGLPNANDAQIFPNDELFLAGDVRANENVELTALQTLFVREHNFQAGVLKAAHPTWTDEQLYQGARAIVIGEIQSITYNEFLPALLGNNALTPYRGYNSSVNVGITNEFSTAAYRFGHSAVGNDVEFLDNNGNDVAPDMSFAQVFFNPAVVEQTGIDPILKYLASDNMQEIDTHIVDPLRNFLFGAPGDGGMDLASLNIQRGRDNGLASYNDTRKALGLAPAKTFADITSDPTVQAELKSVYGTVDKVDLWVGGLAENHVAGGSMGQTFTKIIADQFQRLRDGDRFFYLNQFHGSQLAAIQNTSLADIIARNTTTTNLQDNVFFFKTSISGHVTTAIARTLSGSNTSTSGSSGTGLSGIKIELLDANGNVVATTTTDRNGAYQFSQLDLGSYTVRETGPAGATQEQSVSLTKGKAITAIDFLESTVTTPVNPTPASRPGHNFPNRTRR